MVREIRRKCKECGEREIVISEEAYRLMLERGENLPTRCEVCREKHRKMVKGFKTPYFQVEHENKEKFTTFDYYLSAYVSRKKKPLRLLWRESPMRTY